ncbi:hypothetical protein [Actinoplanes sp. M2I2]|uniref:hypothetical protein n=1 Tax=Actinoplanes sp. M2I2 TaxID=1734444 RepID=UPI0020209A8D|nr:hypothetical protein [Actinoplanes sp. M2I2]
MTGVLHFAVDVVHQHLSGHRPAGTESTYYFGLHSAYALGQVAFAALAILVVRSGSDVMSKIPGQVISLAAVAGWFVICLKFIEYMPPRINIVIVACLLVGAAATA